MRHFIIGRFGLTFSIAVLLLSSCSKKPDVKPETPTLAVASLNVTSGPFDTSVTITGTGFDANKANDQVFFNGKAAIITAATSTQITAAVPLGAGTGNVTVSVNNSAPATGPVFTYQLSAVVTTIAGNNTRGYTDGKGTNASFYSIWGLAIDPSGNIYVSDGYYIRKMAPDGTVTTMAGNSNGNSIGWDVDGKGSAATFSTASAVATDASGNVYIADGPRIRKMTPDGTVSTIPIGNNISSQVGDLTGIVLDAAGNIFASDAGSNIIIKIKTDGTASVFAGNGAKSSTDGVGASASFDDPIDMAIDGSGNIFVTDLASNKIRKVTPDGTVTTIAGSGTRGAADGPAATATFHAPDGIAVDKAGDLYVSDYGNSLIRMISASNVVSTIAGTGQMTDSVDGIGTAASFGSVDCLKVDASGNIYVADYKTIRKITFQ